MIAVFVNSMADTATFAPCLRILRVFLSTILQEQSWRRCLLKIRQRHLCALVTALQEDFSPLICTDFCLIGIMFIFSRTEIIGIWCYASDFARIHNLRGFFTYMFISNTQECLYNRCGSYDNEVVYEQNRLFAERVRGLITENRPMEGVG